MTTIEYDGEMLQVFETRDKLKLLKWPPVSAQRDQWARPMKFKMMGPNAAVEVEVVGYSLKRREVKIELTTGQRVTVDHDWLLQNCDHISL